MNIKATALRPPKGSELLKAIGARGNLHDACGKLELKASDELDAVQLAWLYRALVNEDKTPDGKELGKLLVKSIIRFAKKHKLQITVNKK
jgi:hypothetical protein